MSYGLTYNAIVKQFAVQVRKAYLLSGVKKLLIAVYWREFVCAKISIQMTGFCVFSKHKLITHCMLLKTELNSKLAVSLFMEKPQPIVFSDYEFSRTEKCIDLNILRNYFRLSRKSPIGQWCKTNYWHDFM